MAISRGFMYMWTCTHTHGHHTAWRAAPGGKLGGRDVGKGIEAPIARDGGSWAGDVAQLGLCMGLEAQGWSEWPQVGSRATGISLGPGWLPVAVHTPGEAWRAYAPQIFVRGRGRCRLLSMISGSQPCSPFSLGSLQSSKWDPEQQGHGSSLASPQALHHHGKEPFACPAAAVVAVLSCAAAGWVGRGWFAVAARHSQQQHRAFPPHHTLPCHTGSCLLKHGGPGRMAPWWGT